MLIRQLFKEEYIKLIVNGVIKEATQQEYRKRKWEMFIKRNDSYEKKFQEKLVALFAQQEKEALRNLSKKDISADWVLDFEKWIEEFKKAGEPFMLGAFVTAGTEEIGELATGISFDLYNERIGEFLDTYTIKYAKSVNETTSKALGRQLKEAMELGEGNPQIAKRFKAVFGDAKSRRSLGIARTETIRSSNAGTEEAYIQSGVVKAKEWSCSWDKRTCLACQQMDGRRIELGKSFDTSGLQRENAEGKKEDAKIDFAYTDGAMVHPPLHGLCRCSLLPVV